MIASLNKFSDAVDMSEPSRILIYDNGGETIDRYTAVTHDIPGSKYKACLGLSEAPFHPQGFCQHSECLVGPHLGKLVAFDTLPKDVRCAILAEFETEVYDVTSGKTYNPNDILK